MSGYIPSTPPAYLSAPSANALISDLQPTSISPGALTQINLFLDEILFTLLASANSLNPGDVRLNGVPAVFAADKTDSTLVRALGRSAVGEAELELRSWIESNGSLGRDGFGRDGQGNGMRRGGFALQQAYEVMRSKCEEFSTLAGDDAPRESSEQKAVQAWTEAGGSPDDKVLSPAALYITAILEHVCEHVLSALARVIGRDSGTTTANVDDLFTAMAEDASIWGFFKKMQTRVSLEEAVRSRQKRATVSRVSADTRGGRGTPAYADSQISLVNSASTGREKTSNPPSAYDARASHDSPRSSSIRKSPSLPAAARYSSSKEHARSPSVLSAGTRNMIGAYNDQLDGDGARSRSKREEEDDFDALVASGETMKVSLTPSRLKTFEGRKGIASSPTQNSSRRDRPGASPARGDELPPLIPSNTPPRSGANVAGKTPGSGGARNGSLRAGLQPKLQARSGSILVEADSEELDDGGMSQRPTQQRKASLAELLAESENTAIPEGKRTVPAVILGSAPPPFNDEHTEPASALSASNQPIRQQSAPGPNAAGKKRTPAQDMADFFNEGPPVPASPAPRTEAREMADFFNSTSPPASTSRFGSPIENIAPSQKRGLKGLMSKIGGGGKSKDRKPSWDAAATSPSEEIPTAGGSSWASAKGYLSQKQSLEGKRQRSMASMATGTTQSGAPVGLGIAGAAATSATAVVEAYRDQQARTAASADPPVPPVPSKTAFPPSAPMENTRSADNAAASTTSPASATTPILASGVARKVSQRKPVPYTARETAQASPDMNVPPSPTSSVRARVSTPVSSPTRKPSTVDEDIVPDQRTVSAPTTTADVPARGRSLRGKPGGEKTSLQSARDSSSFVSAHTTGLGNEAAPRAADVTQIDSVPEAAVRLDEIGTQEQVGDEKLDTVPEAAALRVATKEGSDLAKADTVAADDDHPPTVTLAPSQIAEPQHPSIPLSDLVVLRQLLSSATSVKECQLLLSAILSQLGVPLASADEMPVDPESRIAAWLLTGAAGPGVGYGMRTNGNSRALNGHGTEESRSSDGEAGRAAKPASVGEPVVVEDKGILAGKAVESSTTTVQDA